VPIPDAGAEGPGGAAGGLRRKCGVQGGFPASSVGLYGVGIVPSPGAVNVLPNSKQ